MIVLGLDLAPKRVGIALASTEGRRYCTSAAIAGPHDLRNLLSVIAETPDVVAVEDATFGAIGRGRVARAAFVMGWADMARQRRWPESFWHEYPPKQWRSLAGIDPGLKREQAKAAAIVRALELRFLPEPGDHDAAEAACIAYAALVDPRLVHAA